MTLTDILSFIGWCSGLIFSLLFISTFAGHLPVFSCVLKGKWLNINGIHFSGSLRVKLWLLKGLHAIAGGEVSCL